MPIAFEGPRSVSMYYNDALIEIKRRLEDDDPNWLLGWEWEALAEHYCACYELPLLRQDPSRQRQSDRRFVSGKVIASIDTPLVHHDRNYDAVQLCPAMRPAVIGMEPQVFFRQSDDVLEVHVPVEAAKESLRRLDALQEQLNAEVQEQTPVFRARVRSLVQKKLEPLSQLADEFDQTMRLLGIVVMPRSGAVWPVDVQVKREIQTLRTLPAEPYLTRHRPQRSLG